jgi:hypothetical protein
MTAAVLLASGILGLLAGTALAAPTMHGTFTTPLKQGTVTYTAQRAFAGGSEGVYKVAGVSRPGSMYRATGGGVGLAWYYGYSGLTAANALVSLQPDGTYSGPVWFFDRAGNTIDSGTITVTFPQALEWVSAGPVRRVIGSDIGTEGVSLPQRDVLFGGLHRPSHAD